jgi:hypothetical protein
MNCSELISNITAPISAYFDLTVVGPCKTFLYHHKHTPHLIRSSELPQRTFSFFSLLSRQKQNCSPEPHSTTEREISSCRDEYIKATYTLTTGTLH